jgi:hypothetical protein
MLAVIANYWLVTLPTLLTGFLLLRTLNQARKELEARTRVAAVILQEK